MKISSEMMLLRKYFLGILLVCVFLLALFKLPSCAVNYDEITTLHVSALAWSEIGAGSYVNDANPQMYYVLVKLIVGVFHNPELPLRLMSVLMHLVSIVVVYRMGVLLEDINAGMLIAILYAIHPVVFQLGLFIRPYALLVMLSNLCIYFAVRAWQSEKRYCAALVLCCCVAAMLAAMTHYFGLLLFPVCIGVAFFKATRRKFLLALFSMAAVGGWMFLQSQAQAKVHYQEHLWDVSFKIERILYGFWWANAATAVLLVVLAGWGAFISRGKHRFAKPDRRARPLGSRCRL